MEVIGQKVNVNGLHLYYEKVGCGNHVLLLCPGALGCTKTDFNEQIYGLNREHFTIIAWDPPGYGQSRPPDRQHDPQHWHRDADHAAALMKTLGYSKYSILGWSNGGVTGIVLASRYPERVQKLVIWGASSYITLEELNYIRTIADPSKLHDQATAPFVKIYGRKLFNRMWYEASHTYIAMGEAGQIDICVKEVEKVQAPTLIIHGDKDAMNPRFQVDYLHKHIKRSRLIIWKDGKHNLHIRFSVRFNNLVENFLLEKLSLL